MKRYALCIGNDEYQHLSKLDCAVNDAKAVSEKLTQLGFDVEEAYNLQRTDLCSRIVAIEDKLEENDVVLFYYAGHGFQIEKENVLAPVDFNSTLETKIAKYFSFPIDDLLRLLDKHVNKTKIIILDACRENLGTRGVGSDFAAMIAPQGSIIAFSTSPGQSAKERNGHGLYTKHLLEHMDEPRISIETMFKRVRIDLANETRGMQISWEHTSLIGDFQLNPNTIYEGTNYSPEAIADREYIFDRESQVKAIVEGLKTYVWDHQREAIEHINGLDFKTVRADDLFVLGRNIYQAACGNCYACMYFIDNFEYNKKIPEEAKGHILNGMAFEIYYDKEGRIRNKLKWNYADKVIRLVESEPYQSSCQFISTRLVNEEMKIFYVPGQNEKVNVVVMLDDNAKTIAVSDILYKGRSIYYNPYSNEKADMTGMYKDTNKIVFEADLRKKMAIMDGYLRVRYEGTEIDEKTSILVPLDGYSVFPWTID